MSIGRRACKPSRWLSSRPIISAEQTGVLGATEPALAAGGLASTMAASKPQRRAVRSLAGP